MGWHIFQKYLFSNISLHCSINLEIRCLCMLSSGSHICSHNYSNHLWAFQLTLYLILRVCSISKSPFMGFHSTNLGSCAKDRKSSPIYRRNSYGDSLSIVNWVDNHLTSRTIKANIVDPINPPLHIAFCQLHKYWMRILHEQWNKWVKLIQSNHLCTVLAYQFPSCTHEKETFRNAWKENRILFVRSLLVWLE